MRSHRVKEFKNWIVCLGIIAVLPALSHGQLRVIPSMKLGIDQLQEIVRSYHPIVKQTDLQLMMASAHLTLARAGFDPTLYSNIDQKTFGGTQYYNYFNTELKIPLWYGMDIKTGIENNGGNFLNTESSLGQSSYLGLSVPLAKNLVIDKRRATVQQAKILKSQTLVARSQQLNDLMYDVYSAYWNWARDYQQMLLLKDIVENTRKRVDWIKQLVVLGDRPAIDSTESIVQLQQFEVQLNEGQMRLKNAALSLSNFLWMPDETYYQLPEEVSPAIDWNNRAVDTVSLPNIEEWVMDARINHPKMRKYFFKQQELEIDRKLKFQSLLPTLNVKANLLSKSYNVFKNGFIPPFENNNKFGVEFGLPLRLSEGRASYKLARLKIRDTRLESFQEQQAIENKLRIYFNEGLQLQKQVKLQAAALENYQVLLRGELTKFNIGESSLFLLNSRENKVLEAQQKLVDLIAKFYKNQAAIYWAAGKLGGV
ncbi:MAG: hypothetical protein RLY16_2868 [Bacteroidota bacterium]|jgi:outer membrane protein TolC